MLVVAASLVAVVWQLGLLPTLGFSLDPYSILVPFLVFAIGMSHGAQKMNGIMQDIGRGTPPLVAARLTFRRLFLAGLTALLADAVGFAVLLVIDIQAIRELAIAASVGVAVLIVTNLIVLPILLSYTGVGPKAARRSVRSQEGTASAGPHRIVALLVRFTTIRWATGALVVAVLLGTVGFAVSRNLSIGDLDPGAPELRADSRYNRDVAFMTARYGATSDVLAVMVKTPDSACSKLETLNKVDALEWRLRQVPSVESTNSLALLSRRVVVGLNEGNPKWYDLLANQDMLNTVAASAPAGLFNESCGLLTLYVYLHDHRAQTLTRVVDTVEAFASDNDTADTTFLLAAGSAGIEAATNIVVRETWHWMLVLVYGAVAVLCYVTFRSWRAVVAAMLPLMLTSILAEALMVALGIGVKVATLPVIALGVGIGVDYALYILSVMLARLRAGDALADAYRHALLFTGKVVMLTGLTLALGVVTWVASPISSRRTWACCSRSCSSGTWSARWCCCQLSRACCSGRAGSKKLRRRSSARRSSPASPSEAKPRAVSRLRVDRRPIEQRARAGSARRLRASSRRPWIPLVARRWRVVVQPSMIASSIPGASHEPAQSAVRRRQGRDLPLPRRLRRGPLLPDQLVHVARAVVGAVGGLRDGHRAVVRVGARAEGDRDDGGAGRRRLSRLPVVAEAVGRQEPDCARHGAGKLTTLVRGGGARLRRGLHDLHEDLALLQHPELVASAFLDRARTFLQVANLGGEALVARVEFGVDAVLRGKLLLHLAHVHPAALAEPQRELDRDQQREHDDRHETHRFSPVRLDDYLRLRNALRPG